MKTIASLAIVGLIQQAVKESVTAVETLSQRIAMLIPDECLQGLIDGVPVGVKIIDQDKFYARLAKALSTTPDKVRLHPTDPITVNRDGRIEIPVQYQFTCYAKTKELAEEYARNNDYYSGSNRMDDEHPFEYVGWRSNTRSAHVGLADEWGFEVERF